jgi:hypothetical protein
MPNAGTTYTSHKVATRVVEGTPYFGKSSIEVTYRVQSNLGVPGSAPAGIDLPYGLDLVLADSGVLPRIGTPYPAPGSGTSTWQETALCRSLRAQPADKYIDVVATFDTMYFYTPANFTKMNKATVVSYAPAGVYLPARTVFQSSRRSANVWRSDWTTGPDAASDTTIEIAGTMISAGKTPTRVDVAQMKVRMKLLMDTESQTPADIAAVAAAYVGKRNSDKFLGFTAGTLVCDSANVQQVDAEFYELAMEYTWDEWFHHNQTPGTLPNGEIQMYKDGGGAIVVKDVFWKREKRTAIAFNDIFGSPATDQGGVWRYMAENGVYY